VNENAKKSIEFIVDLAATQSPTLLYLKAAVDFVTLQNKAHEENISKGYYDINSDDKEAVVFIEKSDLKISDLNRLENLPMSEQELTKARIKRFLENNEMLVQYDQVDTEASVAGNESNSLGKNMSMLEHLPGNPLEDNSNAPAILPTAELEREIRALYNAKMLEDEKTLTNQYKKLTLSEKDYAIWALEEEIKAFHDSYNVKLGIFNDFEAYKKKQQSNPNPQSDLSLAPGVAVKEIQNQQADYAKPMVQAYNEINASAENHWIKMLSGQENFSQGMKSITKDLTQSITQMWIKMMYQQYIYKPLQDWFTTMIGGSTAGASTAISNASAWAAYGQNTLDVLYPNFSAKATGGPVSAGGLYLVGEKQPELFVPDQSGRIYPSVNSFMDQQEQVSSAAAAPSVTVNVYDRSGSNVQVSKQVRWDGSAQQMIVEMFIDAKERNVMGLRDALATG
jgi:hypothetical protein